MNNVRSNSAAAKRAGGIKDLERAKEYRCPVCRRLLMRGKIITIETRCPKCKKISIISDQ